MELIIRDNVNIISNFTAQERALIVGSFTLSDERKAFVKGGFDRKKIEKVKFYNNYKEAIIIAPGLLYDILTMIKKNNIQANIKDERTRMEHQDKEFTYDELRSYFNPDFDYVEHQIRALKRLLSVKRGIIKASTSSGKTETFLALCKILNLKTLILVNRQDLGRQTAKRLNDGGFPILYRGSDKKNKIVPDASYVCTAGIASELPNDFDLVIVDECHRACSPTFQNYLSKSKAKLFFGFSATPEGNHKSDFMSVRKYLGNIIEEIDIKELIKNEVIVLPKITMIETLVPELPSGTSWKSVNENCIVNNTDRNELIRDLVHKHNEPTLILIRNVLHGRLLSMLLGDSVFVSGEKGSEEREEAIKNFTDGKVKVLIASNIFNEGISINAIRVLINASGGKSKIETVQKLGRALRKDEGKEEAIVYDFYDIGQKITQRHSAERKKIYEQVGFPVEVLES